MEKNAGKKKKKESKAEKEKSSTKAPHPKTKGDELHNLSYPIRSDPITPPYFCNPYDSDTKINVPPKHVKAVFNKNTPLLPTIPSDEDVGRIDMESPKSINTKKP